MARSEGLATTSAVGGPVNVTATFSAVTGQTSLTVIVALLQSIDLTRTTQQRQPSCCTSPCPARYFDRLGLPRLSR